MKRIDDIKKVVQHRKEVQRIAKEMATLKMLLGRPIIKSKLAKLGKKDLAKTEPLKLKESFLCLYQVKRTRCLESQLHLAQVMAGADGIKIFILGL